MYTPLKSLDEMTSRYDNDCLASLLQKACVDDTVIVFDGVASIRIEPLLTWCMPTGIGTIINASTNVTQLCRSVSMRVVTERRQRRRVRATSAYVRASSASMTNVSEDDTTIHPATFRETDANVINTTEAQRLIFQSTSNSDSEYASVDVDSEWEDDENVWVHDDRVEKQTASVHVIVHGHNEALIPMLKQAVCAADALSIPVQLRLLVCQCGRHHQLAAFTLQTVFKHQYVMELDGIRNASLVPDSTPDTKSITCNVMGRDER
jgi:hypothetical protein